MKCSTINPVSKYVMDMFIFMQHILLYKQLKDVLRCSIQVELMFNVINVSWNNYVKNIQTTRYKSNYKIT